jgi:hypothetical protein
MFGSRDFDSRLSSASGVDTGSSLECGEPGYSPFDIRAGRNADNHCHRPRCLPDAHGGASVNGSR